MSLRPRRIDDNGLAGLEDAVRMHLVPLGGLGDAIGGEGLGDMMGKLGGGMPGLPGRPGLPPGMGNFRKK